MMQNPIKALTRPRRQSYSPSVKIVQPGASRHREQGLFASDELQKHYKSMGSYSQYVQDFINDAGEYAPVYNERQLEMAYRTSYYLFAAIRRVANLFSRLEFIAEVKKNGKWVPLDETHHLNSIFANAGARFLYEMYIFYALFGEVVVYKRKTRKAVYAVHRGNPITTYAQGAIKGVHLIPNAHWTKDEDQYGNEVNGFYLNVRDDQIGDNMRRLDRGEVVYCKDFDPRYGTRATSMASLVLNNAVTNAAIARWAAHYFMSGALPLLLVSTEEDPAQMMDADLERYKNLVQRAWRGLWGKFSLRAVFTDRKLNVQEAGIDAEKVQAPELNRDALNAITSVFQIAPDLIVPPEGGSDNARHKFLVKQAYEDAVLPVGEHIIGDFTRDFGLENAPIRLVISTENIEAMEADRADRAATETQIFQAGVQTLGQTQERLKVDVIAPLKDFMMVQGQLWSVDHILREDKIISEKLLAQASTAWNDGAIKLNEYRNWLGLKPDTRNGYKHEIVPPEDTGGGGFGGAPQLPPGGGAPDEPPPSPPPSNGAKPDAAPEPEAEAKPEPQDQPTDGDKAAAPPADDQPAPALTRIDNSADVVPEPAQETPAAEPPDPLYVALWIGEDSLVHTARSTVETLMEDVPVTWSDPANWHITLSHLNDATEGQAEAIARLLPETMGRVALRVNGIVTFDTPDGTCIALAVERDDDIENIQNRARIAIAAQGLRIHEHGNPEQWTPHITLGYAPAETAVPEIALSIIVQPSALTLGRSGFEVVHSIPCNVDWRTALGNDTEPLETDFNPNALAGREAIAQDIERRRMWLRSRVRQWFAEEADADGLPEILVQHVEEVAGYPPERVLDLVMDIIGNGDYDEHTTLLDNPILEALQRQEGKKAMQDSPQDELKAWAKFALKNGAQKAHERFEISLLPLAVEQAVRSQLETATDRPAIRRVFEEAQKALETTLAVPTVNEDEMTEWAQRMAEAGLDDLVDLPDESSLTAGDD